MTAENYFAPYFGSFPPPLVFCLVTLLAFVSLRYLDRRKEFTIWSHQASKGFAIAALTATLFATVVIVVDCFFLCFPSDLNVPTPQSLFFYPAMGFVVEVAFHALPLALLFWLGALLKMRQSARLLWSGVALASLLEPLIQVAPRCPTRL